MPKGGDIYYIEVLGKALDVLQVFGQTPKPRLSLQEVSALTRLNKNTVFRILYTLTEHGFVQKENQEYELGPKLLEVVNTGYKQRGLVAVAGPYLDALRDRFGETVNLGVLDGGYVRYVDVRESPERFRLAERVGGSDPLHCTALGKSFLAYLPFTEVRRLMRQYGMPRRTARTITTLSALKRQLEKVRRDGYACDAGESMEGAFCVGAPILDSGGTPQAAISVSGPNVRLRESRAPAVARELAKAIAGIRVKLGFRP